MMLVRDQAIPGESLSVHSRLRFAVLWVAVVLIGLVEGYVLLPFGLVTVVGAFFLTRLIVWRVLHQNGYVEWWESLGVLPEGTPDVKAVAGTYR